MRQRNRKIIYLMRYSCLSIFLLFLIGNGLLYAQETSEVVDDWSPPQLTAVSIISNNTNTAYAKVGDTVWVYFTADEPIDPAAVNVKILGQGAALYRNKDNQTLSNYVVMDSRGAEGLVGFSISNHRDSSGNEGSTVSTVTNGSSITFDRTEPNISISSIEVTGGNVVPNYFNSTNTGIAITVPIDNDASIINSSFEIVAKVNGNDAGSLGSYTVASSDLGSHKTLPAKNNNDLGNFGDGNSITFYGKITDVAGNSATGDEGSFSILVDKSAPKIGNKRIYSSSVDPTKAGFGDIVYVEFTASEKIDTVTATIGGQPIDGHEHLRDFTSRVWRRMTSADTEGVLSFSLAVAALILRAASPPARLNERTPSVSALVMRRQTRDVKSRRCSCPSIGCPPIVAATVSIFSLAVNST
jgi:hypothetical protein